MRCDSVVRNDDAWGRDELSSTGTGQTFVSNLRDKSGCESVKKR
jgi:hypothetical protein